MDLANMRANGATHVDHCRCGHCATIDVDRLPGGEKVPASRIRYRCSKRGARPYTRARTGRRVNPLLRGLRYEGIGRDHWRPGRVGAS